MQVVCLQEEAFYALFDKVVEHMEAKRKDKPAKWVDGEEAMLLLKIKSTTTLQKLRDEVERTDIVYHPRRNKVSIAIFTANPFIT